LSLTASSGSLEAPCLSPLPSSDKSLPKYFKYPNYQGFLSYTVLMNSLFRRKKRSDSDGQGDDDPGKKKGDWKRPASAFYLYTQFHTHKMLTELFSTSSIVTKRYGIQAATTQGLAAHPDTEDCAPNTVHYWSNLRTDRRSTDMGLSPGLSSTSSQSN
jgi:hypothetical protein